MCLLLLNIVYLLRKFSCEKLSVSVSQVFRGDEGVQGS